MDEKQITKNIKKFRRDKGISLEELAKLSGLTKGYVSKIENSYKAPPFSTLIKIANALSIDIGLLIMEGSEVPEDVKLCITKKNDRKEVTSRGSLYGYHYEALAHKKVGKNMEPYIMTLSSDEKAVFSHEGEEFIYVLEGQHEFIYDNKTYLLDEGDSVYFDSSIPHSGRGVGRKKTQLLAVMYSYERI